MKPAHCRYDSINYLMKLYLKIYCVHTRAHTQSVCPNESNPIIVHVRKRSTFPFSLCSPSKVMERVLWRQWATVGMRKKILHLQHQLYHI